MGRVRLHGIMAFDPGGTTGAAWGVYDLEGETLADRLAGGVMTGCGQLTGGEPYQAAMMYNKWREFEEWCYCNPDVEGCTLVVEDFILRPGKAGADRAGLSPVRLTAMLEALLMSGAVGTYHASEEDWAILATERMPRIVKQQPSAAKSFATKDRMKRWGCWQVGMQHARDAQRHLCLYLAGLE